MKKFNLQEFKKNPSQKVVTRDGKPVRILCTDAKGDYPIVGLIHYTYGDEREVPESYTENGSYDISNEENQRDLFFAPKKGEGWVNVYKIADTDEFEASFIFSTKEEAEFYRGDNPKYVATIKIEW